MTAPTTVLDTQEADEHWWGDAAPVLMGWVADHPPIAGVVPVAEFAVQRFNSQHRLDRKIELVVQRAQGAPAGRIGNIFENWHRLREMGCLVILGPAMSDACIEVREIVDEYRVPTISAGASADIGGDCYFNVAHGSIPDESYLIANWLVREGHRRVAVTWDTAYHAGEYLRHLRAATKRAGIDIVGERRFSQLITQQAVDGATAAVAHLRQSNADALVHLGSGFSGNHIAEAVLRSGWEIPRIMNDAFYASAIPEMAGPFEGWVGIAGFDEENTTFTSRYVEYLTWLEQRTDDHNATTHPEMFAVWYTLTTAACEGVALAPILSHSGVKRGLESVAMLPSAVGGRGSVVQWSHHNHRGLRGADIYVLRKIVDGASVMEMRFDPTLVI